MAEDNTIFIGEKPFMNYVTAVVMQFTTKDAGEIFIKARGKFISRAVDVAEVSSKRFLNGQANVGNIKVDSEEFTNKEGRQVRVSTIEITLTRK
jgi:DNA-binding protein